jgi:predicted nucleic acid-binding protein
MLLIIDTNVLFSFFHPGSNVRELVKLLREKNISLLVPLLMFEELLEILPKILKNCKLSMSEFIVLLELLLKIVRIVPQIEFEKFLDEAKKISPHSKDISLFALSLAFDKSPIWSREPRLKKQKSISVLSDDEVIEYFELSKP